MKTKCLLFLLWLPFTAITSQKTFQKIIKNQEGSFFEKLRVSPDGKTIYAITYDAISTQINQIDAQGNVDWTKKIVDKDLLFTGSALALADGLLLPNNAYKNGLYEYGQLTRIDKNGNLLWCKRMSKDSVYVNEPIEDNDGNFWFTADRISNASVTGLYTYLIKIDKNGNFLQGKRIVLTNKKVSSRYLLFDKKTETLIFNLVSHDQNQLLENQYLFAIDKTMKVKWAQRFQNSFSVVELNNTNNFVFFVGFIFLKDFLSSMVIGKINPNDGKILTYKVIVADDYPYLSCNSKELAIGFFRNNRLSRYNENLMPIWTTEFTACVEKTAIIPTLFESGECYFTRNIQEYKNFIFGKTNPQGLIESCDSKKINYSPLKDTIFTQNQNFTGFSIENANLTLSNVPLNLIPTTIIPSDYCPNPDAAFELPKNVCENVKFSPFNIKNSLVTHKWIGETSSNDTIPKLYFTKNGLKKVFHSVTENGCSDTTSRWITVLKAPNLPGDSIVCNQKSIVLNLKNVQADTFLLDKKLISPPISISKSGVYNLIVKTKVCQNEGNIKVDFVETPPISFLIDSTYCQNEPFFATINDHENVIWDSQKTSDSLVIRDNLWHNYEANYKGCLIKGTLQIPRKVCPLPEILFVPDIFSPNDDGSNDFFEVYGQGFTLKKMSIFDRWGNHVFNAENSNASWDGTYRKQPSLPSVYTYYIEYQDLKRNILRNKKGDVMLMR